MNLRGILDIVARSDPGRSRSRNEDVIAFDADIGVVALADGMGGVAGGEVASALAVETVMAELRTALAELAPGESDSELGYSRESLAARQAVIKANETIYNTAQQQPEYLGMGTTVVVGLFYDNRLTVAHVGDSRMYRCRAGRMDLVTVDHTLIQELVDHGFYTLEEARQSLNKNLVTRALGSESSVAVDIQELPALPHDVYLMCSDGLHDMIEDRVILETLNQYDKRLDEAADKLVEIANENGGQDNVSLILTRLNQPFPAKRGWGKRLEQWLHGEDHVD